MKYLIFFLSIAASQFSWAQQESQFINTINNPFLVNPAAGGLAGVMQFEATSRTQWTGYNGGPKTMLLIGSSQIKTGSKSVLSEFNVKDETLFSNPTNTTGKIKHIVGGKIINDAIGPFAKTSVHGSYSFHMPFSKEMNFGGGVGLGWSNFRINQDRVVLYDEDDALYSGFLGSAAAQNFFDVNAGLVFYNERFFGGISVYQALQNDVVFNNVATESEYTRHYFLVAKYKFDANEDFQIEPGVVGKFAQQSPLSFDIGLRVLYHNALWVGMQYRTSNAFILQAGANIIKNFYISYGYEISSGAIRTSQNGTHEVQLGIYIGNNRKIKKEIEESKKSGSN